jgi:hypothetical protein
VLVGTLAFQSFAGALGAKLGAHMLIQGLALRRPAELAEAWNIAWSTGNQWRQKLAAGRLRLPAESQATLDHLVGPLKAIATRRQADRPR